MPRRFLHGPQPAGYPLGLIGPLDMDPQHSKFVRDVINKETFRLKNLTVLVMGLRLRLSYSKMGGIEAVAKLYAGRYWYEVRIYREFKTQKLFDTPVPFDAKFFADAKGFVVFDDGSADVILHKRMAKATGKPVVTVKLPEEAE